jgi:hypothetical protein
MTSQNRIHGVRLKTERAKKHIRDLDAAIGVYIADKPYTIGTKPHPVPAIDNVTLYVESLKSIPDDVPLILGDAIHNLRSALDHLAWQLVEAGGGAPSKDTYFPVAETEHQYKSAIGKGEIQKIPADALKIIEAKQSYVTLDQNLWLLHHLDIVDKHRVRLSAGIHMDKWGVQLATIGAVMWWDKGRFALLKTGDEVGNLPRSSYNSVSHEDFQLGADVAFSEPEVAEGEPVLYVVKKLADLVDGIIGQLEPFLI